MNNNKAHPLVYELQKLRESSKHAIADGNSYNLDEFKEYLHIEREVESKLKKVITENAHIPGASLIMICGNVGDGKSHTLSRLNNELKADMSAFNIHNDAYDKGNSVTGNSGTGSAGRGGASPGSTGAGGSDAMGSF